MPRKIAELSNIEIGRMRSNISRQNSKIGTRLQLNAMGLLKDKDGNPYQLTSSELKAIEIIYKTTIPSQVASTVEDVTPGYVNENPQDIQQQYLDMVKDTLAQMSEEDRNQLMTETSKQ
jgi:hypothetical protein